MGDQHRLTSVEAVRAIIGEPNAATPLKVMDSLDEMSIDFIRHSPFLMLATADAEGRPEVSPKGDQAGFVTVVDSRSLLIPDRKGNRLLFSLQNVLANPQVAIIFLVPGTEETLRVQGRAELTSDPATLRELAARGQAALLAIRVTVETCFFHCAKAFKRAELWRSESWPPRQRVSFGKQLAPKLGGSEELAKQIDEIVETDYKENL